MGIGATFANDIAKLFFQGTAIANLADNAATSPLTSLYLSLHTADPTSAGTQTSSEAAYTGYARVALVRTSSGWTVTGNVVNPVATVSFPAGTAGSGTATFFMVGTAVSGTGKQMVSGSISPSIVMGNGITPQLTTATALTIT